MSIQLQLLKVIEVKAEEVVEVKAEEAVQNVVSDVSILHIHPNIQLFFQINSCLKS